MSRAGRASAAVRSAGRCLLHLAGLGGDAPWQQRPRSAVPCWEGSCFQGFLFL